MLLSSDHCARTCETQILTQNTHTHTHTLTHTHTHSHTHMHTTGPPSLPPPHTNTHAHTRTPLRIHRKVTAEVVDVYGVHCRVVIAHVHPDDIKGLECIESAHEIEQGEGIEKRKERRKRRGSNERRWNYKDYFPENSTTALHCAAGTNSYFLPYAFSLPSSTATSGTYSFVFSTRAAFPSPLLPSILLPPPLAGPPL